MVEQLQFCVDSCSSADGKYTTLDEAERRYVKKKRNSRALGDCGQCRLVSINDPGIVSAQKTFGVTSRYRVHNSEKLSLTLRTILDSRRVWTSHEDNGFEGNW